MVPTVPSWDQVHSGWPQEPGSPEQSKEQQCRAGVRPGYTTMGYQVLDPVKVQTDVGVDSRQVGLTTAHSPAHNSNLIPQPLQVAD